MTGVPIGSASVSATGRADSRCPAPGLGTCDGLMVGNSPAALPPGLMLDVDPLPPMVGRLPTGSGDTVLPVAPEPVLVPVLLVAGADGLLLEEVLLLAAVPLPTGTLTDAFGSVLRSAALSVAVSLTEVTVLALAGTATLAITCRAVEPE